LVLIIDFLAALAVRLFFSSASFVSLAVNLFSSFAASASLAVRLYGPSSAHCYGVFESIPRLSKCRYNSRQAQASVAA
jgi:hypothetical protein